MSTVTPRRAMEESLLLGRLADSLDIPRSYYEKAKDRAKSLERWFNRDASGIARLSPDVFPQGSFRYGTVIRPLLDSDEYDLDLVCALDLSKADISQKLLKELIGKEIDSYAETMGFLQRPVEKHRCWRLNYADEVQFHMDVLPSVPEDATTIQFIVERRVPLQLAQYTIGITDRRHPSYHHVTQHWFSSNPRGFAEWFENRMRRVSFGSRSRLVENGVYASIDEVPPYEWKTPLQRAIQILKRHRDVMFQDDCDLAPISMIITTLSAQAYDGEQDLYSALANILTRIEEPGFVRSAHPRIPNPVNPEEDFADRWATDRALEENFWWWHAQAKEDLSAMLCADQFDVNGETSKRFGVRLDSGSSRASKQPAKTFSTPSVVAATSPAIAIATAPKPWSRDA